MAASGTSPHAHGRSEIWERASTRQAIRREQRRLGRCLRAVREERELTQERAAERTGIHPKHLQRIEQGSANATVATLVALAMGYQVPLRTFFDGEPGTRARRRS
ncbi:MAG: helix-turn-helix transcriptional regulator [Myxococcales bacterium]|nr:helix-turn-helix transcriptional regulator [Myxococcales bacterium]